MKSPVLTSAFLALAMLIASCSDDPPVPQIQDAPEIPPLSTMVIDFTDFANNALDPSGGRVMMLENWGRSAFTVVFWNAVVVVNLAVPVAAFVAAINETPEFDAANASWVWTYNFEAGGVAHSAQLKAKFVSSGVQWDMFISRDGVFEDFLWYTGVSNLTATEGTWSLRSNPGDPTPLIDIDWSRSATSEIAEIRYTNVIPDDAGNGGYLEYGITEDTGYDAFYNLFNIENNNTREIQWNRETKAGRIKDPAYYADEEFHCWDQSLMDVDC